MAKAPMSRLQADLLRGVQGQDQPEPPKATFASDQDVRDTAALQFETGNQAGKLFLGLIDANIEIHRLPDGRQERYAVGGTPIGVGDDRHIITVAGSRSGKGRAALLPNLFTYPGSMLVIDPKGDLARLSAEHRANALNQKVFVLDPFGAAGGVSRSYAGGFNPLSILREDSQTLVEDAGLIADALIVGSGGNDPHWDESSRMFVETLVLHVATWPRYSQRRDLITVYELAGRAMELPDGAERYMLEDEFAHNESADGAVKMGGRVFYERSERELESVLSTVRRHLHFLGYRQMKPALRPSRSIDLADLKRQQMTIYLSLPAMRMGTCSRWLRLFVNLTLAAMEVEKQRPRYPVLLCLDEFAVLGPMKTIEDAAGQIAGLDCKLWPILQDLGQLIALYKDRWETFMGNAGVLQFFGNSDLTTLEWISKRLGQTTVINPGRSDVTLEAKARSGASGASWSQSTQDLMTAEEVSRYFGRDDPLLRQLIIRPTFPPMILQRAFYDKHEMFCGRA